MCTRVCFNNSKANYSSSNLTEAAFHRWPRRGQMATPEQFTVLRQNTQFPSHPSGPRVNCWGVKQLSLLISLPLLVIINMTLRTPQVGKVHYSFTKETEKSATLCFPTCACLSLIWSKRQSKTLRQYLLMKICAHPDSSVYQYRFLLGPLQLP